MRYDTPGGRVAYIVAGSTDTYAVDIDVFRRPSPALSESNQHTSAGDRELGHPRHFCTCPAFAYSVLLRNSAVPLDNEDLSPSMCKHILSVLLASRMQRCNVKLVSIDEVDGIYNEVLVSI